MAARATPEAGHTGETLPLVNGVARPSLPAAKYAPETTMIWNTYFRTALTVDFRSLATSNMAFEAGLGNSQALSAVYLFLGSAGGLIRALVVQYTRRLPLVGRLTAYSAFAIPGGFIVARRGTSGRAQLRLAGQYTKWWAY